MFSNVVLQVCRGCLVLCCRCVGGGGVSIVVLQVFRGCLVL